MKVQIVESFAQSLARQISRQYAGTPVCDMIDEAIHRRVQPEDLFSDYTSLVDAASFFEDLTGGTDSSYQRNAFIRIFKNGKAQPFYKTLLGYLDSIGTGESYPKLEPALLQRGQPADGRHRAALCILLDIKLPVKEI